MRVIKGAELSDIVRELRRMLNDGISSPEVRTKGIEVMQEGDEIASVFNWSKDNFTYVPDPHAKELFVSPRKQLEKYGQVGTIAGDCDDAALFIASILGSLGYETKVSLLDTDFDSEYDHAIGSVNTTTGWIDLDLTCNRPLGWVEQYAKRMDISA